MAAPAPASQRQMRQHNLSHLLQLLADEGPASRASLAARTGLTRPAVSTLTEELLRTGMLVELGPDRPGRVGRPGSALALADTGPCGLGAEVGVDRIAVCAMDLRGQVRVRREEPSANRASDPAVVLARLRALTDTVAAEARTAGLRPTGLAVAVPALVHRGSATVVHAPNLGWQHTDPAPHLGGELPVTVDNEANYAALAHLRSRAALRGAASADGPGECAVPAGFLHVSAAAGIGAAVVQDGDLVRGMSGYAGELGHVPVFPTGPHCACGGRGCLEQYAGEPALLRAAGLPVPGDGPATADGGDPALPAPRSGDDPDAVRAAGMRPAPVELLAERARAGDRAALRALGAAGRALGIALSGAVNLLDPGAIVLGGSLVPLGRWLLPAMERELHSRTAARGEGPVLLLSPLGADGPLLGAAQSVVDAVLADPLAHAAG